MPSIRKTDYCNKCDKKDVYGGCLKTDGHPSEGMCIAAEWIKQNGYDGFLCMKQELIDEINKLNIKNLVVHDLNLLNGSYVNLEYPLPNGQSVKLLKDNNIYLGNQIEIPGNERCYGVVTDHDFLLVCEYGCNGADPQIVMYKRLDFTGTIRSISE